MTRSWSKGAAGIGLRTGFCLERGKLMELPPLKLGNLVSRLPIVQGGMGVGISMSGLASAVANEGGIGVIASVMAGIDEPDVHRQHTIANTRAFSREIRAAREKSDGVLGVNIMVVLTEYVDLVQTAIKEKVDVIFSGAGLPMDLPRYLIDGANTKLVPIVSSARAAILICRKWMARYNYVPDGFVVEGPKAGGHLGFKPEQIDDPAFSLEKILKDVIDAVKPFEKKSKRSIPVIAAGGIYTGEDIDRMLRLGAQGVQMGTRFVATHECDADEKFKQAYVDAQEQDLMVIKSPVGMPGRALKNCFLESTEAGAKKPFRCVYHCIKTCELEKSPYCIALALGSAKRGLFKYGFAFAGANAYRVSKIVSVRELMDSLKAEWAAAQERWTGTEEEAQALMG
jgi:nitronate monooxygenase